MAILLLDILTTASMLFIVAAGLMIILGVMKLINFAHGAFLTVGGYAAHVVTAYGYSPWRPYRPPRSSGSSSGSWSNGWWCAHSIQGPLMRSWRHGALES